MDSERHALMRGNEVNFELDSENYPIKNSQYHNLQQDQQQYLPNQQDFFQPHSLQQVTHADSNQYTGGNFFAQPTSNAPAKNSGSAFYKHYKDITFDTLKERHDNFSFEKVLEAKNELYNTMNFEGLDKNPNNPNLVIYFKQKQAKEQRQKDYNNSKY